MLCLLSKRRGSRHAARMAPCTLAAMIIKRAIRARPLSKERKAEIKGLSALSFNRLKKIFRVHTQVIEAGGIEGVSAIIGYHNNPHLKPGQIGLRSGAIMAGVEQFEVTVLVSAPTQLVLI